MGRVIIIKKYPKVLIVFTTELLNNLPDNYKLVSIINYTGGHYYVKCIRGDNSFIINDSIVRTGDMIPSSQSVIFIFDKII